MPTPAKPVSVLMSERKSHRSKAELRLRENGEKANATGVQLKERPGTKSKLLAHKEFKRVTDLLKKIGKNDAIYEPVINRYCMIQAECDDLEVRREHFYDLLEKLDNAMDFTKSTADELIEFTRAAGTISSNMIAIDKLLQSKRKMLLDIEKENIMTIAAALRSIPKKEEKQSNPLLDALGG